MNVGTPSPHSPLDYVLTSQPSELKISTTGKIVLKFSTKDSGVQCKYVELSLPYGPIWSSIFADKPTVKLIHSSGWLLNSSILQNDLGSSIIIKLTNNGPGHFFPIKDYVTLEIYGTINQQPGQITFDVKDDAGIGSIAKTNHSTTQSVNKVPDQFYVDNLIAADSSSPNVPKLEFKKGKDIQFSWEGNATNYQLYAGNSSKAIFDGKNTTYSLTGGISRDTTFLLKGSYKNGGADLTSYKTIALNVSNPLLENVTIGGKALKIEAPADFRNELTVNPANTSLQDLIVEGPLNIGENMQVLGDTVFGKKGNKKQTDIKVYNTLDIKGELSAKKASIEVLGGKEVVFSTKTAKVKDWETAWFVFKKTIKINTDSMLTASIDHQRDKYLPDYNLQAFVELIHQKEVKYKTAAMAKYDSKGNISWAVPGFLNVPLAAKTELECSIILMVENENPSSFFSVDLILHPLGRSNKSDQAFKVLASHVETAPFVPPHLSESPPNNST